MVLKFSDNGQVIHKCCPDCGSTNYNHMSWCKIHLTPAKEYEKKLKNSREFVQKYRKLKGLD